MAGAQDRHDGDGAANPRDPTGSRPNPRRDAAAGAITSHCNPSVRRRTQAARGLAHTGTVLRRLPNRTPILVRPIRPDDKLLLEQGLQNLSETSVQRRFLAPKPKFTQAELRYLTEVDGHSHVALVAESPTQATRTILGVARYVKLPDDPEAAEVAVVVADHWQGRGVGSLLIEELGRRARARGFKRFTATMAADNVAAHRLMAKLTRKRETHLPSHGVTEMVMDIAA